MFGAFRKKYFKVSPCKYFADTDFGKHPIIIITETQPVIAGPAYHKGEKEWQIKKRRRRVDTGVYDAAFSYF